MGKRALFYIFHPKKHLTLALGFPSNAEDFEIGVVVSTKHEDCGQGGLRWVSYNSSFGGLVLLAGV
jgi:hypothetical protein